MTWVQFSQAHWLAPHAGQSYEALVVLLQDVGDSVLSLTSLVARWTASVPMTVFTALTEVAPTVSPADGLLLQATYPGDATSEPAALDRRTQLMAHQLKQQLRFYRLDASRLVLVGFGHGGTLALHLLLRWNCAGALTFAARLVLPLPGARGRGTSAPGSVGITGKVRLIEYLDTGRVAHAGMRDVVASLAARGIDVRGVVLAGPTLSEEAIRHGGAYLVELVATAQGGRRLP
ncbi:MAG TPA: hypothetical protein VM639_02700 [Dongiaceae bacterium]|nr:hypothetical protein [Dongiaceae bacterium]